MANIEALEIAIIEATDKINKAYKMWEKDTHNKTKQERLTECQAYRRGLVDAYEMITGKPFGY